MFIKDFKNGIGIYYEKKGHEFYLGEWVKDYKEGVATIYNPHWTYEGTVKNDVRVGLGFLFYDENVYIGRFKDNMFDKAGIFIRYSTEAERRKQLEKERKEKYNLEVETPNDNKLKCYSLNKYISY